MRAYRIAITGIWHQGMVLAAGLAELGHSVTGVAANSQAVAQLSAAEPLVHEPGLAELLRRNLDGGRLSFTTSVADAVDRAEIVFISTDTPVDDDDRPQLESIVALAEEIGRALRAGCVLCVTAQVEVGTSERLRSIISEASGFDIALAYVPEFLRLGEAVDTFLRADRFVVGCDDSEVAESIARLFEPLGRPIVCTTVASAELAKHASNAFLATSISFANEIADLCEVLGADAGAVADVLRLDSRIGPNAYLSPGVGFAGATLGRDVRTIQALGSAHETDTPLADAVMAVNDRRGTRVLRRIELELGGLADRRVALVGLAYKAGTDTLRRALSLELARALAASGVSVTAYDPLARVDSLTVPPPLEQCASVLDAARGCDAVVVLVGLPELDSLDLGELARELRGDLVLDTTGRLGAEAARQAGLRLLTTGRGA